MRFVRSCTLLSVWLALQVTASMTARARQPQTVPAGAVPPVESRTGVDAASGLSYVLISMSGRLLNQNDAESPLPRLTGQCTREGSGKLRFDLLADAGGVPAAIFYPPSRRPKGGAAYPTQLALVPVTMEFFGYTKVKPVRRQWERLKQPVGEVRYSAPGWRSSNLEPVQLYLRYLKSLPLLRLTIPGKGTLEFETTQWQEKLRAEPLCKGSGL